MTPKVFARGFVGVDHERLRRLKAEVDPNNMFRVNFNIEAAGA